jgi:hypothetical protein
MIASNQEAQKVYEKMTLNQKAIQEAKKNRRPIDDEVDALKKESEDLKNSNKALGNMKYETMQVRINDLEFTQKNKKNTAMEERKLIQEIQALKKDLPNAEKLEALKKQINAALEKRDEYNAKYLRGLEKEGKLLEHELKDALGDEEYQKRQQNKKDKKKAEDEAIASAEAAAKRKGEEFNKNAFLKTFREKQKKSKDTAEGNTKAPKEEKVKYVRPETYEDGDIWSKKIDDNIENKEKNYNEIKELRKKFDNDMKAYWDNQKAIEIYNYHVKVKEAITRKSK